MTADTTDLSPPSTTALRVHFPDLRACPEQDREWCEIEIDGERKRIRFHDYAAIYSVPGLYETIFYEHLECASPEEVCGLLGQQLRAARVDPGTLSALDVGAGNGMVAEELQTLGVDTIVGIDLLEEAATAAERDRPGVYVDYLACDLTDLSDDERARMARHRPNLLTTVAALGFGDIPPKAFAEAYNALEDGAWIAFNIKEHFLGDEDESGFSQLIVRMIDEGRMEKRAHHSYCHRLSVTGDPLMYVAVVGVKRADIPADWL